MAKKTLDDAYLDSEVNFINGKIDELSMHHISERHHLAWKTINELSGKKVRHQDQRRIIKETLRKLVQPFQEPSWKGSQTPRKLHSPKCNNLGAPKH